MKQTKKNIAVVGAGWAGLAAAVRLVQAGHAVTLFEAAPLPGGRARDAHLADGQVVDCGQHILIAGYARTLDVLRTVGVDTGAAFMRVPMTLEDQTGRGLHMPAAAQSPIWAVVQALWQWQGVGWTGKLTFALAGQRWKRLHQQYVGSAPPADKTVAQLCNGLPDVLVREVVEPLCVSALNTPIATASAKVFVRVLYDSLWQTGDGGGLASDFLLPKAPLGTLFPAKAVQWLQQHGAEYAQQRVQAVHSVHSVGGEDAVVWQVETAQQTKAVDAVVLACPVWEAVRLVQTVQTEHANAKDWLRVAGSMEHKAIATVYVHADYDAHSGKVLSKPLFALPSMSQGGAVAQFVFDRGQIGSGTHGELAFVVSDCVCSKAELEAGVLAQCTQLGLGGFDIVKTIVEKRATFACTAGLQRPNAWIADGLYAAGDWVDGVYPATLEGAVLSGEAVVGFLKQHRDKALNNSNDLGGIRGL